MNEKSIDDFTQPVLRRRFFFSFLVGFGTEIFKIPESTRLRLWAPDVKQIQKFKNPPLVSKRLYEVKIRNEIMFLT